MKHRGELGRRAAGGADLVAFEAYLAAWGAFRSLAFHLLGAAEEAVHHQRLRHYAACLWTS